MCLDALTDDDDDNDNEEDPITAVPASSFLELQLRAKERAKATVKEEF